MLSLPFTLPRWAWYAIGAALLVVAILAERTAFGNRRFNAGEAHADAAWQKASDELLRKAANARTAADKEAAARDAEYAARVKDERARLEKAEAEGTSPFDVIFGRE